jgi:ribosomal-protein-alanine N-acetyltransferase
MKLDKPLTTDRLLLRTLGRADANDSYLAWMNDPEVNHFPVSCFTLPTCQQDLVNFIELVNISDDSLLLGIFLREEGCHIGNVKIGPIITRHARSEIGYLIGDRISWGKGYAAEAIREVCRYAFEELGLAKITAGVYDANKGSAKALLKAGFTHIATIPSDVIFEDRRIASLLYGITITD